MVSRSFYPQNSPRSFRASELAIEFARQRHDVTVIIPTGGKDYTSFETEHNLRVKDIGVLKWREIRLKGRGFELLFRRAIRRCLSLFFEYPDIELMRRLPAALKTENGYDILISIAVPYPIHWGVALARTRHNRIAKIWVADCGDPYMGDTVDSFGKLFYFRFIEKWFCRKADFITIPFEGAKSAYYPEFQSKIRIIPQGLNLDNLRISEYKKTSSCPVFAYAGGFVPGKRDLGPILAELAKSDREFKLIIYTSQSSMLMPYNKALGERLEVHEKIPREELLLVLSRMDFLLNLDNNTHTQLPSKLIDYKISGRPVLNICSATNISDLYEFMDGNYSKRMELDSLSKYDIKKVAQDFLMLNDN